jgi:hypothetical protein
LRQVLQHLSNAEIQQILPKLNKYQYLIVSEHIPEGEFVANVDIISGQGIRLKKQSGVDLLAPPFSLMVTDQKQLLLNKLSDFKGLIITNLYTTR